MELTEKIETINQQLMDEYGIDTLTGMPMWRVVWSNDQFEHRLGTYEDYTESGIYLRTVTEVRYVLKYPWIKDKYVLEDLVIIPEINSGDLPATRLSYEPKYPFQDNQGNYLPPSILACRWVIDCINMTKGKGTLAKYKDKESGMSKEDYYEMKNKEIDAIVEDLFGNETDTGDAIAHGEAIIVPRNYEKES